MYVQYFVPTILEEKDVIDYIMPLTPFLGDKNMIKHLFFKIRFGCLVFLPQVTVAFSFIHWFLSEILSNCMTFTTGLRKCAISTCVISTDIIQPNISAANKL